MKWRGRKGGGQIEDRRGQGGGIGMGGGMPFPIPIGKGGGGIGMILIVLLFVFVLPRCLGSDGGGFGIDPGTNPFPQAPNAGPGSGMSDAPPTDEQGKFVRFVLGNVEETWTKLFADSGKTYDPTTVVLFTNAVQSACGTAPSAVGPFYCPRDQKVYIDLSFFDELSQRFGAPGDFAQAYVIAHEIGHHVQNLLGVSEDVNLAQQENPDDANELSVRLELQADCLAGVWGHSAYTQQLLEPGDLEEGLDAAAAIGDDRIQEQAGRNVDQESWTHGSSEQRVKWFRAGFDSGDPSACDTFKGDV
jgi:uncharacterized protein